MNPSLVDHVQRALEDGVEDLGDLRGYRPLELVHHGGHGGEDLRLSGGRHRTPLVVEQHGVKQRRDEVFEDHVGVVGALDPARDELEGLLLDDAHRLYEGLSRDNLPVEAGRRAYVFRHYLGMEYGFRKTGLTRFLEQDNVKNRF